MVTSFKDVSMLTGKETGSFVVVSVWHRCLINVIVLTTMHTQVHISLLCLNVWCVLVKFVLSALRQSYVAKFVVSNVIP